MIITFRPKASFLISIFILMISTLSLKAQTKDEVIKGSYFVAFGRYPNSGELNYWRQNVGNRSIKEMVILHKDFIRANQYEREQTIKRSYLDAFGWQPSSDEVKYWSGQYRTYGDLVSNHINNWLNVYKDKKEQVIRQSYHKVFNRNATTAEVKYWMGQPTYSFVQLVAMHTTWKQQNQTTSKMTNVAPYLNRNGISTDKLSSSAISGVIAAGGLNLVAPGTNVISAGGGNVVSAGGGN